jgi:hypothetical protein
VATDIPDEDGDAGGQEGTDAAASTPADDAAATWAATTEAFDHTLQQQSIQIDEEAVAAATEIAELLGASVTDRRNKPTSLRLNVSLREAAEVAVAHGWSPSFTALVEGSLATALGDLVAGIAEQAALDQHYEAHPDTQPELWEIAVAAARIDGRGVAEHPDLVQAAAAALGVDGDVDTLLAWAEGALAARGS